MIPTQNWRQLASIQIGGAICLPMIMIGHTLGQTYGLPSAWMAILLGNALLLGLALLMFRISYPHRLTTIEQASLYFGPRGIALLAFAMASSMMGWFGIQLNVMSQSLMDVLSDHLGGRTFSPLWLNMSLGCLITGVALYGMRAINRLANLSLPVLIVTLGYALYIQEEIPNAETRPFSWQGISLVLAAAIAAVIDLPTYFRLARSPKDGWMSLVLIFGIALPLIEATGVYLASHGSGNQLLDHLKHPAYPWWNGWIALFLLLAGWTTNNINLYSGAASLSLIFSKLSEQKRMALLGILGTGLSCLDLLGHFEFVLDLLGILLISMGAVILTRAIFRYWIPERQPLDQSLHLQAWITGIVVGLASLCHLLSITTIATLDTFLATLIMTFILLTTRKYYETAYPL